MKEKPIIFSGPMVRAILDGTKTQTRRIVKGLPESARHRRLRAIHEGQWFHVQDQDPDVLHTVAPLYQPGQTLWVREKFAHGWHHAQPNYLYAATDSVGNSPDFDGWKPSIHMPREASRITLEVTAVRCERLQDISEADAIAEGVERFPTAHGKFVYENYRKDPFDYCDKALSSFASLWQSIHGPDSWSLNPWVWVYEFRRVKP